ncbi:M28 family peptidase [Hyphomonas sp.]|uniref:M28 family peptidase n=1 Tax=Hyphomonas sp. TaxID=87 RepID=UPI0030F67B06
MSSRKAWGLVAILGVVALVFGGILLSLDRDAAEPSLVQYNAQYIDAGAMLRLTETLSSDALEGRATGSRGNEAARDFIQKRFETLGLRQFGDTYFQPFTATPVVQGGAPVSGVNVVGWIAGQTPGDGPAMVITAHYDHLGIVDGEIYNGADDNASGVAALVAVAQYFTLHRPRHDMIFAVVDAEEIGHLGSNAFVASPPVPLERIALNINYDMVSRSDAGEIYVAGTFHTPELKPIVETVATEAPVRVLVGHDDPALGEADDWTLLSDHEPFHEAGIPFLYFGVENHPAYHQPTDDYTDITPDFFARAGDTLVMAAIAADDALEAIEVMRRAD